MKQEALRVTILILCLWVLTLSAKAGGQEGDRLRPDAAVTGHYEIRQGDSFRTIIYLTFWHAEGKLLVKQQGNPETVELKPSDTTPLTYYGEDAEGRRYTIEFTEDDGGNVRGCIFAMGDQRLEGEKTSEVMERRLFGTAEKEGPTGGIYSVEELRDDLGQLRRAIEFIHPGTYNFTPKAQFDELWRRQTEAIDRDMTLEEFYRVAAPAVAAVGCGHSRLITPEGYWDTAPAGLFPLPLRLLDGNAYVLSGREPTPDLPYGSMITAINGRPMSEITAALESIIPADGFNSTFRRHRLRSSFGPLYALRFGYSQSFKVSYIPPGQESSTESVIAGTDFGTLAKRISESDVDEARPDGGNLQFELIDDEKIAVITIKTFAYYQKPETFYEFIDSAFASARGGDASGLILDFRGNDGGDPRCTTHLLSYLASKPVPYFSETYPQYEAFARPIPTASDRFSGEVFVLTDGGCFSSTGHLCAVLKHNGLAKFVGEETGGTYTCTDASILITLHNTKLRATVARMRFTAAAPGLRMERGIIPDYPVKIRMADLLEGRDPVMEAALSLARQRDR